MVQNPTITPGVMLPHWRHALSLVQLCLVRPSWTSAARAASTSNAYLDDAWEQTPTDLFRPFP